MNVSDFRKKITEPLKKELPDFDDLRVVSSYEDLLVVSELANEIEAKIMGQDPFTLAEAKQYDDVHILIEQQYRLATLLKALYLFSDIFVSVTLSEVLIWSEVTLVKFLNKPRQPLLSISVSELLSVYCAVIYRNKIIAHHEVKRQYSFIWGPGPSSAYVPLPKQFFIQAADARVLRQLTDVYKASIPLLAKENNQFEQLQLLFYNIPIGSLGQINNDRRLIDKIAEQGGCKSMSREEILTAIDQFAQAVVNSVQN